MMFSTPDGWRAVLAGGGLFLAGGAAALLLGPGLPDLHYFLRNWLENLSRPRRSYMIYKSASQQSHNNSPHNAFSSLEIPPHNLCGDMVFSHVSEEPLLSPYTPSSLSCTYSNCRVLPGDIDRNLHMSNDRYLFHLNFARKYFFCQFGVWEYLWQRKWNMVVSAQSIRYRKELKLWQRYSIQVRLVGWSDEDKSFYLESYFVAPMAEKGSDVPFIHAVHWTKYRVLGNAHGSAEGISGQALPLPSKILAACDITKSELTSFDVPAYFKLWIDANYNSSSILRAAAKKST